MQMRCGTTKSAPVRASADLARPIILNGHQPAHICQPIGPSQWRDRSEFPLRLTHEMMKEAFIY
jgi:hypothetical protein